MADFSLTDLERIVAERAQADPATSYTAKLKAGGIQRAAKKLGEEAAETVIAAVAQGPDALTAEAADLLYHLLVVLHVQGVSVAAVMEELSRRTAQSGLQEKAGRALKD